MARNRTDIGGVSNITLTDLSKHPWTRKTKNGEVVVTEGWRARGRVKDRRGKFRDVCVVRPTKGEAKREAERRLAKLEARIKSGVANDAPRTVGALAERWLTAKAKTVSPQSAAQARAGKKVRSKRRLSPNTLATYASATRCIILKHLGDELVEDLTVVRLDELFEALDEVMSTDQARTVLRQMLDWAVAKGLASFNPMRDVSPSNRDEFTVKALKTKDARRLIAMARADVGAHRVSKDGRRLGGKRPNRDLADFIVFGLGTGARVGEILAVRVCDLSLDGPVPSVDICGTMVEARGEHIKERFRQGYPKNKSRRRVPLPDAVVDMLRERLSSSPFTDPDDPVFASTEGTPLWSSNIRTRLRTLTKGDPLLSGTSPHTLRRSVATRLYTGPGGLQDACDVLGHSPGGVTFKHYVERRRVNKRVRKRLNGFFKTLEAGEGVS